MTEGALPIPRDVTRAVAEVLEEPTRDDPFREVAPLAGGCIHSAARVETRSGRTAFLKWAGDGGPSPFGVEARGLRALARRGGLRVPRVLGFNAEPESVGWLLLEYIPQGTAGAATWDALGLGLARLHRPLPGAQPGWEEDGWIGTLFQPSRLGEAPGTEPDWPTFWRDFRLRVQWERAADRFDRETRARWDRVTRRLAEALTGWEADGLSLLHGDLWSGNVLTDSRGEPVLLDPAVYRGHREVDLAMMELFGGFPRETFERYHEARPVRPGYREVRRDVYQLYPLLVHVNLFGSAYTAGAGSRIAKLARAFG